MSKLLIIDSNFKLTEKLKENFENESYEVDLAKNYNDAAKLIEANKPSLIISEVLLDDINGLDLLDEIKQSQDLNDIPFIFLTAVNDLVLENRAWRKGVDAYYSKKTVKKQELQDMIARLINQSNTVTAASEHSLEGNLAHFTLSELVSALHSSKKSGILNISYDSDIATLKFYEGEIFYSAYKELTGVDVIYTIIKNEGGSFQFDMDLLNIDDQNMDQSTQTIIKLLVT